MTGPRLLAGPLRTEVGTRLDAVVLRLDGIDARLAEHCEMLAIRNERLCSLEQHAEGRLSKLEER